MDLQAPVKTAGQAYKIYAKRLEKLGITKIEDFLYHIPFRYEDYSLISKIGQIQEGEIVTVQGKVTEIKNQYTRRFKTLQKAKIEDDTGLIEVIWFNQPYLAKNIKEDDKISLSGKVEKNLNKLTLRSPDYEIYNENVQNELIHTGRLVPIYPETKGVSSKWLRRQIYKFLNLYQFSEYLPDSIIKNNNFVNFKTAMNDIHFPKKIGDVEPARKRLAFDELFLSQLSALKRKRGWEQKLIGHKFKVDRKNLSAFLSQLPFELTNAQKNAVEEIITDLENEKPMNRLLEGDVGSGKTVVAMVAVYICYLNKFQSVLMAPTEILANQHYKTIGNFLAPLGVRVHLVTSNNKLRKNIDFDVLVGTHAVISKKVQFDKLGLVVIDEQQRFGVEQRAIIRTKGKNPHFLTMTATPIPRTVALTLYGDLNLSYLDEMPKGRKKIKTWLVPKTKREDAYTWLKEQIDKNKSQIFIVCPFIEESETLVTVRAATKEFEKLKSEIFRNYKLGLLHGKLKPDEKDRILKKFRDREIDVLVSTPVVEVGIDIPNATVMMVEGAERFGLAQLHQLRGRVGRGDKQSYCLLFTEIEENNVVKRLKSLEILHDGAKLSEIDLKFRGPGEIYGTLQHGIPMLKIASFSES
ncbi:MAG: ATP-dependent DNA helicase RecG, partial [Patescibacteria group bacterium]|nr:ATP-dependent DNA helicase RecG [Patescibacteria group bacterium]